MSDTPIILDLQGGEGPELEFEESDDLGFESQPYSKGDKGDKGDTGKGISSISFVSASGDEVTLLVTYDDGTSQNLVVSLDDATMFVRGTDANYDPVDGAIRARAYTYDGVEYEPKATGLGAFALSGNSEASGKYSVVDGVDNTASGFGSLAIGDSNIIDTGDELKGSNNGTGNIAIGWLNEIHSPNPDAAEGANNYSFYNLAYGYGNHIEPDLENLGPGGSGRGEYSRGNIALGWSNKIHSTTQGVALGNRNKVYGNFTTVLGNDNLVHGASNLVLGQDNSVGRSDASENNIDYGESLVQGRLNFCRCGYSSVSGIANTLGSSSIITRSCNVSGRYNQASANFVYEQGSHLKGTATYNHIFGYGNIPDPDGGNGRGRYIEIVGNASQGDIVTTSYTEDGITHYITDENNSIRSNARTLDWSGNEWVAGKVSVGTEQNPPEISADNELTTKKYVDDSIDALGTVTPEERTAWNASLNAAVNANECLTFWHASDVI